MLWCCIHLPKLSLEALAPSKDFATAIFVQEKNARRLISTNALDVHTTDLTTALSVNPSLHPLERNQKAELAALQRLAAWAYQWSSHVTWQEAQPQLDDYSATIWLEIGASRALFDGYPALVQKIEQSLRSLKYSYNLGIAPTLAGAAVLARAGKRVLITSTQRLRTALLKISIQHLALTREILNAFQLSGITTIGSLLALPTAAIARRFGSETTLYLEQLCGNAPDLRIAYRLPNKYCERCDFGYGVHTVAALLFPLQRMLHEFCGYLRALDIATQQYDLFLEHEHASITQIDMGFATPTRDAKRLFVTAKEKFHNLALANDVYALRIEAQEFTQPAIRQQGLFIDNSAVIDELPQTLDKIVARLGQAAVQRLQMNADHRPEFAAQSASRSMLTQVATPLYARPLWLLPQPQRLSNPPTINSKCERIEAGWWQSPLKRDYYLAQTVSGESCWVYLDRTDNQWYLHGYWS